MRMGMNQRLKRYLEGETMSHDYIRHKVFEWSDVYKCQNCGKTLCYDVEDMMSLQDVRRYDKTDCVSEVVDDSSE